MKMSNEQLRNAIIGRLKAVSGSCNSTHIDHNDGVFRGLIWAMTGEDPGTYLTADVPNLLQLSGIPYQVKDGMVHFEEHS